MDPYTPHPKQRMALLADEREVLFGGAARGGKSQWLLMAAAQFVMIPGYSAIIFRKTLPDLMNPDGLIPRSTAWWYGAAHWNGAEHQWTFPSGAIIKFGFIGADVALAVTKYKYQGARYQFVGWDELTQHDSSDYYYLFSRLDRPNCEQHRPGGEGEFIQGCELCAQARLLASVPMRVRAATNPGGTGHRWVKEHFQIERDENGEWVGRNPQTRFIPARVEDNPAVDQKSYTANLERMQDFVTRKQLREGDWGISAEGRFKESWLRYYTTYGYWENRETMAYQLGSQRVPVNKCQIFQTVDPAGSEREGPGDTSRFRKEPSETAISTWAVTPDKQLIWLDCLAFMREIPDGVAALKASAKQWRPQWVGIEKNGPGLGFFQYAIREGLPVRDLSSLTRTGDKLVRATDAMILMEQGRVWLPQGAKWLKDTREQLLDWTGHKQEACDRIDTLSYAAMCVTRGFGQIILDPSQLVGSVISSCSTDR